MKLTCSLMFVIDFLGHGLLFVSVEAISALHLMEIPLDGANTVDS